MSCYVCRWRHFLPLAVNFCGNLAMEQHVVQASRRNFLAGVGATSLAVGTGLGIPEAEASLSGLGWASGCGSSGVAEFERYRGRKVDTVTCWCPRGSWSSMVQVPYSLMRSSPARFSIGMAVLPDTHSAVRNPGNWRLAARGAFDQYYNQFARNLAATGRRDSIVRIGWEINREFPWYGGSDPQGFKDTFRRVADILRKYNSSVQIEWCNIKKGSQRGSVLSLYPGDDAVDIVSVDYYDGWPANNTQQIWNSMYNAEYNGGPWGIGSWLDFARSRGKKLAVPEWGIMIGNGPGTKDNPFYIQKMYEFFSRNRAWLAYENYFNQKRQHQLTPQNVNPRSAAMYRSLWGG